MIVKHNLKGIHSTGEEVFGDLEIVVFQKNIIFGKCYLMKL